MPRATTQRNVEKLRRFDREQLIDGSRGRWGYRETPYTDDGEPIAQGDTDGINRIIQPFRGPRIGLGEPQLTETHVSPTPPRRR